MLAATKRQIGWKISPLSAITLARLAESSGSDQVIQDVESVSEALFQAKTPAGKGIAVVSVANPDGAVGAPAVGYRHPTAEGADPCAPIEKAMQPD